MRYEGLPWNFEYASMAPSTGSPGPQHEEFITWAKDQGVKVNGCRAAKIGGRGLGMVAERRLEVIEHSTWISGLYT